MPLGGAGGAAAGELTPATDVVDLGGGVKIPRIGLGVFQALPQETEQAVAFALQEGYRHIDTASLYRNEAAVGRAVRNSGLRREEVFLTTKLWNSDHGYPNTLQAFERSLKSLNLDYGDTLSPPLPTP
eukprot:SM006864S21026  [mRNA]  locus=s6864:1:797:- [translate_table: standard]